jgi:cytochrome P450
MSLFVGIILIILTPALYKVLVLSYWLWRVHKTWRACKQFAPVQPHWIKGISGHLKPPGEERLKQYVEWSEQFPKCWSLLLPMRPALRVHHPSIIKKLLRSSGAKTTFPATGGQGYSNFRPWLGDSLLNSSGKKWLRNRRLLTPAFHFDILKLYLKIYNDSIS